MEIKNQFDEEFYNTEGGNGIEDKIKKINEGFECDVQKILDDLYSLDDSEWMDKHPQKDASDLLVQLAKKYNGKLLQLVKDRIEEEYNYEIGSDFNNGLDEAISVIDEMIKEVKDENSRCVS